MSCSKDRYSKNLLSESLRSRYNANVDFVIETDKKYTAGNFDIQKDEKTKISFLLPEEYSSICIYGDNAGNSDVFTFELSGIPSAVPKSIASDFSLLFSLFSDDVATKPLSLDDDCFTLYPDENTAVVSFTENDNTYTIFYNTTDGKPISINVKNNNAIINLTFKNYSQIQT